MAVIVGRGPPMKLLLAALVLSVSLAGCSNWEDKAAPPAPAPVVTTTDSSTTTDQPTKPHTMHGSGQVVPAPTAYQEFCRTQPQGCI
jgi:hypothetical protein